MSSCALRTFVMKGKGKTNRSEFSTSACGNQEFGRAKTGVRPAESFYIYSGMNTQIINTQYGMHFI